MGLQVRAVPAHPPQQDLQRHERVQDVRGPRARGPPQHPDQRQEVQVFRHRQDRQQQREEDRDQREAARQRRLHPHRQLLQDQDHPAERRLAGAQGDLGGSSPQEQVRGREVLPQEQLQDQRHRLKRNFDIDLSWKATKPDWDFSTPESLKIDLNAKGKGPRWGDWSISRDMAASIQNKVISFDVSGTSKFGMGRLATSTPILTEIHMKYLIQQRDLTGKMSKVINGKEYSIEFPDGFGVMPQIKMGQ